MEVPEDVGHWNPVWGIPYNRNDADRVVSAAQPPCKAVIYKEIDCNDSTMTLQF